MYFHASGALSDWLVTEAAREHRTVSNLVSALLTQAKEDREMAKEVVEGSRRARAADRLAGQATKGA